MDLEYEDEAEFLADLRNLDGQLEAQASAVPDPEGCTELMLLDLTEQQVNKLVSQDKSYALWLRVVLLRLLVHTPVVGRLNRATFTLTTVTDFLGLKNFDQYAKQRSISDIRQTLEALLAVWECAPAQERSMPKPLQQNLHALANAIGLNEVECQIMGFAVLIHAEEILESGCDLLGTELTGFNIERILAPLLSIKADAANAAVQPHQRLACSGLLSVDFRGRFGLRQMLDLLTAGFASKMLIPQPDIKALLTGFVSQDAPTDLTCSDYVHVQTHLDICAELLKSSLNPATPGINILLYGKPGTGKTEFARVLTRSLGLDLLAVKTSSSSGAPFAPIRRVRNYCVAQAFFRDSRSVLLFDECEEILNRVFDHDGADNAATIPRKSWINKTLESNTVPTIWIANSLEAFDEAYIRRFSVCFEMPVPSEKHRLKMINAAFGDAIGEPTKRNMARHTQTTPAIIAQAAKVLGMVGGEKSEQQRSQLAIQLVNDKFQAHGVARIKEAPSSTAHEADFDPDLVNSDTDLQQLCDALRASREGRICLYGPPGTGKTAFGQWVAQALEMPHLNLKVSDLMSAYVGETEQKIAQAFQRAHQQKAVLQLDEVDSFLQDRSKAERNWAVTQVNEMLTQMETFNGVFIASTNLFDNLDPASLRRFDMAIRMDFMKPEAAWRMFERTCKALGLGTPEVHFQARVWTLRSLTAGDFEQITRRSRLLPPVDAQAVFNALDAAVRLKKNATSQPMGFLAAA